MSKDIELRQLKDRVAYLEKEIERKNKVVAQFCHATSNTLQPDNLLNASQVAAEAAKQIKTYQAICLGLFEICDDLGLDIGDVKEHLPN
jgi:hypothetical protein